jgi:hypothetical protein
VVLGRRHTGAVASPLATAAAAPAAAVVAVVVAVVDALTLVGAVILAALLSVVAIVMLRSVDAVEVVAAGGAEAKLLGLRRGAPLLAIARTAWDADGRAFERSHDLFRADRARIVVRARSAPAAPTLVGASVHVRDDGLPRPGPNG